MKINNIIKICTKSGILAVYDGKGGEQWISDSKGLYLISNLPSFTPEELATLYGISEKQFNKMSVRTEPALPAFIDFSDHSEHEEQIDSYRIYFIDSGKIIEPYKTSHGVLFLNTVYLSPFADMDIELYLRTTVTGQPFFCVKQGLNLFAVISPEKMLTEDFIVKFEDFAFNCKDTFCDISHLTKEDEDAQQKF